jgi:phosphatidate cytidylyltransferase
MDFSSEITWHVLIVVFGALFVGSAVGFILAKTAKTDSAKATVANLNARMKSWWIMVMVLFGALATGRLGTVMIFALISFLALREFLTATPTRRADHSSLFFSFFIVLPYQFYLVYIAWYGMFTIMIPVYAFVLVPALMAIAGDVTDFLERTARTQWGLMVCVYFISHIPMLATLDVQPLRMGKAGLVLFLVAVTQGSDVLQYVWGKLFGKHPIVPKLSPKKTVEGFVGGVLCASALGAAMFRLTPFTPWQAFVVALLLCTTGFIGGLVMSAIKRARGLKDWGALIEGHGGMMDRMDSLCFSAPVFFHVLRYFFVH